MKKSILITSLTAAGLALSSATLYADGDQPWHLTVQIGGAKMDHERDMQDDKAWFSVGFGRFFGNHFSLDLEYDEFEGIYNNFDTVVPGATHDKWSLSTVGLMGRYHFGRWDWRPFVAAGVGSTSHGSVLGDGSNLETSLGVGVQGKLAKHVTTRLQLLWRTDHDNDSLASTNTFNDIYFSLGLNFDFGGAAPPPPPPPPEPPPPPPPPPNPDLDGDGVLNAHDKCPNTRPGVVVDLDGCEVEAVIELDGVNFEFDQATLKPEGMAVLNGAAALLQQHERVVVEVAGHTDSVGSEDYNQGLSEKRANSVRDYLTSKGVKASRLSARGYGESRPVASNDTEEGRTENRRVELIVLDR